MVMDGSPLTHKVTYGHQTVIQGQGHGLPREKLPVMYNSGSYVCVAAVDVSPLNLRLYPVDKQFPPCRFPIKG